MKSSVSFLTLCLLASAYAVAAGGYEYTDPKRDEKPPKHHDWPPKHYDVPPKHEDEYKCKPIEGYAVCFPYVKKEYYGRPPVYESECCKLIRKETPDCICHAFTYDHKEIKVDLKKALDLPKSCGKKWAKYPCASW